MTKIELIAKDQELTADEKPVVASGNQNTVVIEVDYSNEWEGYAKSAVFFTENNSTAYEVAMDDNSCIIPHEVLADVTKLYIGLRGVNGDEVKASSLVRWNIVKGAPVGEGTAVEATPTPYQQVLERTVSLQGQIDGIVIEATGSGDASAEVAQARTPEYGSPYGTLQARLNAADETDRFILDKIGDTYAEKILDNWNLSSYINTSGEIGSTVDVTPIHLGAWRSMVVPVVAGDVFKVTGRGGLNSRLWAFLDTENVLLSQSATSVNVTDKELTAEADGYLVVNINDNIGFSFRRVYKTVETAKADRFEVEQLERLTLKHVESGVWEENGHYCDISGLDTEKVYALGITTSINGIMTVQAGTSNAIAYMIDTIATRDFRAGEEQLIFGYKPTGNYTKIRIDKSQEWAVNVYEVLNTDEAINAEISRLETDISKVSVDVQYLTHINGEMIEGKYVASTGELRTSESYDVLKVFVTPCSQYRYTSNYDETLVGYAFFNGTKYISGGVATKGIVIVTTPENATIAYFSCRKSNKPDIIVEALGGINDIEAALNHKFDDLATVVFEEILENTYITSGGNLLTHDAYTTVKIPVHYGEKYEYKCGVDETQVGYAFLNGDIFISGGIGTAETQDITVPQGSTHGYFTYRSANADRFSLVFVNTLHEISSSVSELNENVIPAIKMTTDGVSPNNLKQNLTIDDIVVGKSIIDGKRIQNYDTSTKKLEIMDYANGYLVKIDLSVITTGLLKSTQYSENTTFVMRALTIAKGENDDEYVSFSSRWSSLSSIANWLTVDSDGNWTCDIATIITQFPTATCLYIGFEKSIEHPPIYFEGLTHLPAWLSCLGDVPTDVPKFILPKDSVALVGHEWNLYFDNVIDALTDAYYVKASVTNISRATVLNDCLRITPIASDVGEHTVTLSIVNLKTDNVVDVATFTLSVCVDDKPTGKNVLFIGDSLTDAGIYPAEIQHNLSNGGITSLGTRADTVTIGDNTFAINHEGRSGWATYDYTRTKTGYKTNCDNPFYDGTAFNFSYYMQQQGYDSVDAVVIGLGTNGQAQSDSLSALKIMIDSIHEYNSEIPVIVSLVTPPATQDGCGINNKTQSSKGLKRALLQVVEHYIKNYDNNSNYPFVHCAELYFALDCKRDYNTVEQPASARNPMIVTRQNNNVHPSVYGYLKYADVYYNNLVKLFSE